ncbi:MAG: hypothetical protein JNN30_04770 [Rhodanobacteraceae bacterium]|nr:hypothetical protein [Rhodanobacteraceae bacterium]
MTTEHSDKVLAKIPILRQIYNSGDPARPTNNAYRAKAQDIGRWMQAMKDAIHRGDDPDAVRAKHPADLDGIAFHTQSNGYLKIVTAPGTVGDAYRLTEKHLELICDGISAVQSDDTR